MEGNFVLLPRAAHLRKVDSRSKSGFELHGHLEQSSNLPLFSLLFSSSLTNSVKKIHFFALNPLFSVSAPLVVTPW